MQYPLSVKADQKLTISVGILLLFHFCGLIGFHSVYRDWFLSNTPLNLVLATSLLLLNHKELTLKMVLAFAAVFVSGFAVEVAGVKTGAVFGSYHYGDAFGPKLFGVPFVIGMNWAALCFASATLVNKYLKSYWLKAMVAAAVPVSIDFLIERVCEAFDFWYWENSQVPLQNFIAWYVCSFLFVLLLIPVLRDSKNPFAPYFLLVQFIFFLILNITHS
ncbi:carotenoid biosynthesis protein [Pontibacter harenae]|uniref:carotenoid biosynthesis protein n=1 Tax=Pontibacter harenae TaxID=2894083 RepID=UPI001E40E3B1|nr:carotenoid biosynthesis protein [Pontibacter harenae]MCC9168819.1 carotenoid biosynthesis protein [Pontibacter harenae]